MNKIFTKIATACAGLAMAIGVGVAIGNNANVVPAKAADEAYATAVFTSANQPIACSLYNCITVIATIIDSIVFIYNDICQTAAAIEYRLTNTCYTARYCHTCQSAAIIKCLIAYAHSACDNNFSQ